MATRSMLTTIDNPHNPFDDFAGWYAYDVASGYHTASFLARIIQDSEQTSDSDQDFANEKAIEEILEENVLGIYKRITREIKE